MSYVRTVDDGTLATTVRSSEGRRQRVRRAPLAPMTSLTTPPRSKPLTFYVTWPTPATGALSFSSAPLAPQYRLRSSALEPHISHWIVARGRSVRVRQSRCGSARPCRSAAIGTERPLEELLARGRFSQEPAALLPGIRLQGFGVVGKCLTYM